MSGATVDVVGAGARFMNASRDWGSNSLYAWSTLEDGSLSSAAAVRQNAAAFVDHLLCFTCRFGLCTLCLSREPQRTEPQSLI